LSTLKTLFKQTFIYGLATVLPRMLSVLLVRLHTDKSVLKTVADYGDVSLIFSYFVLFNVIIAYGMETAFFRFYNKEEDKPKVIGTSAVSLMLSSFSFFVLALIFQNQIANFTDIKVEYINLVIWILLLDALVIIPFAWLRANAKPMKYAAIKILNVLINVGLNLFFLLWLKDLASQSHVFASIYKSDFEIQYIFIANLVASGVTLLLMLPFYFKIKYTFNTILWKQMMRYAFPVLIAGVAFSINETFDRILLDKLLPESIAKTEIGMYSACYKLALFMTLFATAYRLGIEPFFFSHAKTENPQKNYATILEYFVIFGSVILLIVIVFADFLKVMFIGDEAYWEAMWIVPIVLNFWLIPIMSYKGSAIATLAAYTCMMLASYYFGRKYYPIPYNIKKIGLYLFVSILFSALSFYKYRGNYFIGIGAIIVFLGLVFQLEKKELKRIFIRN